MSCDKHRKQWYRDVLLKAIRSLPEARRPKARLAGGAPQPVDSVSALESYFSAACNQVNVAALSDDDREALRVRVVRAMGLFDQAGIPRPSHVAAERAADERIPKQDTWNGYAALHDLITRDPELHAALLHFGQQSAGQKRARGRGETQACPECRQQLTRAGNGHLPTCPILTGGPHAEDDPGTRARTYRARARRADDPSAGAAGASGTASAAPAVAAAPDPADGDGRITGDDTLFDDEPATPAPAAAPAAPAPKPAEPEYDDQGFHLKTGFHRDTGLNRDGFSVLGLDAEGYDVTGYDRQGLNRAGLTVRGLTVDGRNAAGFFAAGGQAGIDDQGYDIYGYHVTAHGEYCDEDGYDEDGYRNGYDRLGYDRHGRDAQGESVPPFANGLYADGLDAGGCDHLGQRLGPGLAERWPALRAQYDEKACHAGVRLRCPHCKQFVSPASGWHQCPHWGNAFVTVTRSGSVLLRPRETGEIERDEAQALHAMGIFPAEAIRTPDGDCILYSAARPVYRPGYKNGYRYNQARDIEVDPEGIDIHGYTARGLHYLTGRDREGYDASGFDVHGYDRRGRDRRGLSADGRYRPLDLGDVGARFIGRGENLYNNRYLRRLYEGFASAIARRPIAVHFTRPGSNEYWTDWDRIACDPCPLGPQADPRNNAIVVQESLAHEIGHIEFSDQALCEMGFSMAQSDLPPLPDGVDAVDNFNRAAAIVRARAGRAPGAGADDDPRGAGRPAAGPEPVYQVKQVNGADRMLVPPPAGMNKGRRDLPTVYNQIEDARMVRLVGQRYAGADDMMAASAHLMELWDPRNVNASAEQEALARGLTQEQMEALRDRRNIQGALFYEGHPYFGVRPEHLDALSPRALRIYQELAPMVRKATHGSALDAFRAAAVLVRRLEAEGLYDGLPEEEVAKRDWGSQDDDNGGSKVKDVKLVLLDDDDPQLQGMQSMSGMSSGDVPDVVYSSGGAGGGGGGGPRINITEVEDRRTKKGKPPEQPEQSAGGGGSGQQAQQSRPKGEPGEQQQSGGQSQPGQPGQPGQQSQPGQPSGEGAGQPGEPGQPGEQSGGAGGAQSGQQPDQKQGQQSGGGGGQADQEQGRGQTGQEQDDQAGGGGKRGAQQEEEEPGQGRGGGDGEEDLRPGQQGQTQADGAGGKRGARQAEEGQGGPGGQGEPQDKGQDGASGSAGDQQGDSGKDGKDGKGQQGQQGPAGQESAGGESGSAGASADSHGAGGHSQTSGEAPEFKPGPMTDEDFEKFAAQMEDDMAAAIETGLAHDKLPQSVGRNLTQPLGDEPRADQVFTAPSGDPVEVTVDTSAAQHIDAETQAKIDELEQQAKIGGHRLAKKVFAQITDATTRQEEGRRAGVLGQGSGTFVRAAKGKDTVFMGAEDAEQIGFAASLDFDVSGSMSGHITSGALYRVVAEITHAFEYLQRDRGADIAYEVRCFDDKNYQLKSLGDRKFAPERKARLVSMGCGGTESSDSIGLAASALSVMPQKKKVIVVITDGAFTRNDTERAAGYMGAARAGVRRDPSAQFATFGIYLRSHPGDQPPVEDFNKMFGEGQWAAVDHIDELPDAIGRKIVDVFRRGKGRRR